MLVSNPSTEDICETTNETKSKTMTEVMSMCDNLRNRGDEELTPSSIDEIMSISKYISTPEELREISNDLIANAPKNAKGGSISEMLHSCPVNASETNGCDPACIRGSINPNIDQVCTRNVYERTINGLERISHVDNCKEAYVFYTGSGNETLSKEEYKTLEHDGNTRIIVFNRNGRKIRYLQVSTSEISKSWSELDYDTTTDTSSDDFIDSSTTSASTPSRSKSRIDNKCKDKKSDTSYLMILLVIVIVLIALGLLAYYFSLFGSKGEKKMEVSQCLSDRDYYNPHISTQSQVTGWV